MRGLTVIVAEASSERFRAALSIAAAQAALGSRARIFMQGEAVGLLQDMRSVADMAHERMGLPTLEMLFQEALGLGVKVIACQSGMLLCNIIAENLDPRISYGGLVSLLQSIEKDRIMAI